MIKAEKTLSLILIIFLLVLAFYPNDSENELTINLPTTSATSIKVVATTKIFDTIKKGETLSALLIKNGIAQELIYPIINSFKEIYSVTAMRWRLIAWAICFLLPTRLQLKKSIMFFWIDTIITQPKKRILI